MKLNKNKADRLVMAEIVKRPESHNFRGMVVSDTIDIIAEHLDELLYEGELPAVVLTESKPGMSSTQEKLILSEEERWKKFIGEK